MSETGFSTILITAIGLSADCFAVTLGLCISWGGLSLRNFLRFPVAFGFFQAIMMLLGWLAGRSVVDLISVYDHWAAFGLLAIIGGRMIWESFQGKEEKRTEKDIGRWVTLLVLAFATSVDSLAVGLSYAFLRVNIAIASTVTGSVAFMITLIGRYAGNRLSSLAGKWAETAGGVILILIGLRILLEHLF